MPMFLKELKLCNFKNYTEEKFSFRHKVVSISGDNGMGKTNILDAIYYLAMGKSYLSAGDKNLVTIDQSFFRLDATFEDASNTHNLVIKYRLGVAKEIEWNGVRLSKLTDHIGLIPVVFISPDDVHNLLAGNEERRVFINNTLVQFDSKYLEALTIYNRNLKQRNALLKDFTDRQYWDQELLDVLTSSMAEPANYLYQKRKELTQAFTSVLQSYYDKISDSREKVALVYSSQLDHKDFISLSKAHQQKDKFSQRTSVGIHKDEFSFFMNGKSVKDFASQGQLKSYIFGLKLAQYVYLKSQTQNEPILLLDDVFDKLDHGRVSRLLSLLKTETFGQIFITDTHFGRAAEMFGNTSEVDEFFIRDGKIERVD